MLHVLMMVVLPVACETAPQREQVETVQTDSLEQVYSGGQTWDGFFTAVNRRRELWQRNWSIARVPTDLLERARAAGSGWRILVITEPGCSDSANSVPYIAKLADELGLGIRFVNSTTGKPWMEAHRATDGRAATPTVLILDEQYRLRGCWIEQPVALQKIWLPIVARGETAEHVDEKMDWYARDEGRETLRELIEVLEAAHREEMICPGVG